MKASKWYNVLSSRSSSRTRTEANYSLSSGWSRDDGTHVEIRLQRPEGDEVLSLLITPEEARTLASHLVNSANAAKKPEGV